MPRPYNLGLRAEPKADTRARILAAAMEIVHERGLAAASNLAIAKAADVAPATVRNHFADTGELARAVFEAMLAELKVPTSAIFEGATDLGARITRLAEALGDFYERSGPWWRAYEREPELVAAWGGGVDEYYAQIDALIRMALGDLAEDERSVSVVASVIGPPTFFALRSRGMSTRDAVALSLEVAVPWLEQRREARA